MLWQSYVSANPVSPARRYLPTTTLCSPPPKKKIYRWPDSGRNCTSHWSAPQGKEEEAKTIFDNTLAVSLFTLRVYPWERRLWTQRNLNLGMYPLRSWHDQMTKTKSISYPILSSRVDWGCRIHRLYLWRGIRFLLPTSVLLMRLNHLTARLQLCWSFEECRVLLHCHRSQIHSDLEW